MNISRRDAMKWMGCAALCLRGGSVSGQRQKPNVLLIVSDDAGYMDLGFMGGQEIVTPRIDALARQGVVCTNGYVTASVCAPSRAGLMTGRYQQRFGSEFNLSDMPEPDYTQDDVGLDLQETTLADALKAQGYYTAAIGKWHMGESDAHYPLKRGFDEFYGPRGGNRSYFGISGAVPFNSEIHHNGKRVPEDEITYLTDNFTDAAIRVINENKHRPFFIYLSYTAVHGPLHAKKEHRDRYSHVANSRRRTYAGMMASLDEGIGRLSEVLKETGLKDDTLVIFINDNGGATGTMADNGPLRGMKGSKWEGGIRVPFFIVWPSILTAGDKYQFPVSSLDVFPTCLDASGSAQPSNLDGVSLLPYLKGQKNDAPHPILFWRRGVAGAVRRGPWKLIRVEGAEPLLFNLEDDPGETTNLAENKPQIVETLLSSFAAWEEQMSQPRWKEGQPWERNQRLKHRMEVVGREEERRYP